MLVKFVGDTHGNYGTLSNIVADSEYPAIHVGDLGLVNSVAKSKVNNLDFEFIHGNHDNPGLAENMPGFLGRFGTHEHLRFFYVSGAWSIDQDWRTPGFNWWVDEQLSWREFSDCQGLYEKAKPSVMVTHDCPLRFYESLGLEIAIPNKTAIFFNDLWEIHRPKLWIFGHHHVTEQFYAKGTTFQCLGECDSMVIDLKDYE